MRKISQVAAASFLALAAAFSTGAKAQEDMLDLQPCFISGVESRVSCAALDVPLNYDDPDGATVSVHVAVMPAVSSTPAGDPLLVFAGGPGQAAGEYGQLVELAFGEIQKDRDIILIDQRGTGKSHGLRCTYNGFEDLLLPPKESAERCRQEHADIDVRHFTLENIIRDTDEIRERLGYEQLNLWGGSYGTKSVSLYLKRYPERVRSIIVDGVLPPDESLFLSAPSSAERALQKLADHCNAQESCASAFPTFKQQVEDLVARAEQKELKFQGVDPVSGNYLDVELEPEMVIESIRSVMYDADGTTVLPYVVNEAHKGNLQPLMASLLNGTAVTNSMYMGATMSLLCGEDLASISSAEAERAGEGSFARASYYSVWSAYCSGWDYVRPDTADFFAPIESTVPALVLSGDLDPVTPPSMGDRWMKGFPNGRHIVVKGTGHNTSHAGCMPELLGEFIETLDPTALDTTCLEYLERLPIVVSANGNVE